MTHPCPTRRSSDLEVGGAEAFGAIEDLVADGAAARQAFLGHHHARAPDLVFRHIDVAAFLAEAVGHVYLLEAGRDLAAVLQAQLAVRSEEHTSELQSLMRISYAVFCLKKKKKKHN